MIILKVIWEHNSKNRPDILEIEYESFIFTDIQTHHYAGIIERKVGLAQS